MEGLIEEGEDYVKASGDKQVRDARFIGAAQRVETLRNGWYGTVRTLALLGWVKAKQRKVSKLHLMRKRKRIAS
jgi:ferritin-like metal-binding protein YciE